MRRLDSSLRALARREKLCLLAATLFASMNPAEACDVCAVYTATGMRESRIGPSAGVAEQFTRFATLRRDGDEIDNPSGERLESSITQLVAGYGFTPRLGVQANLPLIHRTFRRVEGETVARGDETGVGDLALTGQYAVSSRVTGEGVFRLSVFGGIEFPTGDGDRLREETEEQHHAEPGYESGVHGHDLALGSGSFDGLLGGRLFGSWRLVFATAALQYALRTEGDFDYDYANDLIWNGGPGVFVSLGHRHSLALQAVLSGETKGKDRLRDEKVNDTAITALYLGPGILFTWESSLAADITADLPVVQNNSALQIVPDFRLRGGVQWRFGL